jgi:NTE family protein
VYTVAEMHPEQSPGNNKKPRPKVGLVLSGGSARGMAHLGVLRVLEELDVPVDMIVGASFGAMVGAYYASGYRADELVQMLQRFSIRELLDFSRPLFRILNTEKALVILRETLDRKSVEELRTPLHVLAADIRAGEMVVFDRGDLTTVILASSAFPGLFEPLEYEDRLLIDGGILNKMMVSVARERGAEVVIYSDTSAFTSLNSRLWVNRLYQLLLRRVQRKRNELTEKLTRMNLRYLIFKALCIVLDYRYQHEVFAKYPPDIYILPRVGHIRPLQFNRTGECFRLGYEAACKAADVIERKVFGTIPRTRGKRVPRK